MRAIRLGFLFVLLWLVPWSAPGTAEEVPIPLKMRVLTHNVYMGFGKANATHHGRWRDWMARQKPDVVALQELNGYTAQRLAEDAASWGHAHSELLKEDGFPVGLTSRWPIEEVVRLRDGFHHGLLRGRVQGVHFYAVHFHPSNWEHRIREAELLAKDMATIPSNDRRFILAGDFNGFSPADRSHYENSPTLEPFFEMLDRRDPRAKNLNAGRLDYGGLQAILDLGFVDALAALRPPGAPFVGSFPSALARDENHGPDRRLDYIFVSPNLAHGVKDCRILRDDETALFSDHFPVVAELELPAP